jgi:hypothetical protein
MEFGHRQTNIGSHRCGDLFRIVAPTNFQLVINLKIAKALGLDVSLQLQQCADGVIECSGANPLLAQSGHRSDLPQCSLLTQNDIQAMAGFKARRRLSLDYNSVGHHDGGSRRCTRFIPASPFQSTFIKTLS